MIKRPSDTLSSLNLSQAHRRIDGKGQSIVLTASRPRKRSHRVALMVVRTIGSLSRQPQSPYPHTHTHTHTQTDTPVISSADCRTAGNISGRRPGSHQGNPAKRGPVTHAGLVAIKSAMRAQTTTIPPLHPPPLATPSTTWPATAPERDAAVTALALLADVGVAVPWRLLCVIWGEFG